MSLPVIPLTQRTWLSPDYPKEIRYQAFNIGLQSILIQASDEDTPLSDRISALRQVVEGCITNLTPEEIKDIPIFVIEELFLKIRSISVSESVNLRFKCNKKLGGTTNNEEVVCGAQMELTIDLDKIELKRYEGHINKIVQGDYTFTLKYPCLETTAKIPEKSTPTDIVLLFLDKIFTEDGEVWNFSDYSREEQVKFVDGLGLSFQKQVMEDFFLKQPHIHYETTMVCPKCGAEHKMTFSNLNQVFM